MLKARMTQKMNILKSNMENDMADLELMRGHKCHCTD